MDRTEVTCNFPTKTCLFTLLFVPMGTKEKYKATEGWNQFFDIREMPVENMWPNGESGSSITQIPEQQKRMTKQPLFDINGRRTTTPFSGRLYIRQGKKFLKK